MEAASYLVRRQILDDDERSRRMTDFFSRRLVAERLEARPYQGDAFDAWFDLDRQTVDAVKKLIWKHLTPGERNAVDTVQLITLPTPDFSASASRSGADQVLLVDLGFRAYLWRLIVLIFEAYGLRDRKDAPNLIYALMECWALAEEICRRGDSELSPVVRTLPVRISSAPRVTRATEAEMLVFVILHELAHFMLGHLQAKATSQAESWQREFEADALGFDILTRSARTGETLALPLGQLFAIFALIEHTREFLGLGPRAESSHPPAESRVQRLSALFGSDLGWFDSTMHMFEHGVFSPQAQILAQVAAKA